MTTLTIRFWMWPRAVAIKPVVAPRRQRRIASGRLPARRAVHPVMPMSGRPFLWTRQKAGRLSGWRICSGSTHLMDAHPILNGSLKDIDVYDLSRDKIRA
jgi:hypothetical protein